ncbi:MAG: transglutaminaseTgpA domain-containing protein [Acidovorax sp.]
MPTLPRDTRDTLFLLGTVAWTIAPLALAGHVPPWASAFAALLLLWRGLLAWRSQPLPGRWVLGALLLLAVAGTLATHRTIVGRDAGVTLVVLLLALKTLELRARRDAMAIFFLGFFTLLANFFFSQSLPVAGAMLVALLLLLTALVNAHLPVGRPPLLQSLRTAGQLALWGAPLMAVLFVLFPRIAPLWGVPGNDAAGRSGLSGEMRVGDMATLALDDSVALRVRFLTPDGAPPPQSQLYFRGPVLDAFDGREWLAARRDTPTQLEVEGSPIRYEATLEPHQRRWLLLLDAARDAPTLPEGLSARPLPGLQWQASRPITSVMRYQAQSYPHFRYGPREFTPALQADTALPPGSNPRTRALAAELRARNADPQALVQAALQRLAQGGYSYTLEPGVYGQHTADEFWFDKKAGFCEHIASAFVVLMRAAGVPARIVTGYQGGERNPVDGYWTVRQSDAHAWAEVWLAGQGWRRVDPTGAVAPGRVGQFQRLLAPQGAFGNAVSAVISPGMAQRLRDLWEAANNGWNQWVLNYTQGRQLDLLKSVGFASPSWQDLVRLMALCVAAAALAGVLWMLWERRRTDPWQRLLADARARLAQAGLETGAHLPPRALARRAQAQFGPDAAHAASAWLLRLEQARYAPSSSNTLSTLRRELRTLRWPLK